MSVEIPFYPADILIPKSGHEKWASIACDQYTSQPEYWEKAYEIAGGSPSCLHITLPEIFLNSGGYEERIKSINTEMYKYLDEGVFREYRNALILVERSLSNGRLRRGIVGAFDLSAYSYEKGSKPLIRPTEGTVLSRIPPRVEIRRNAPLELPHIMVLMDDRKKEIIEKIDTAELCPLYDFQLMLGGGRLRGWLIPENIQKVIFEKLNRLAEECGEDGDRLLFAVGDGNHSLASAKAAAEVIGTKEAGYALAELVNIQSEGVDFEPVYRVLFNADTSDVAERLKEAFPEKSGRKIEYFSAETEGSVYVDGLETELLQNFLDAYAEEHPEARIDYIHGISAVRELADRDGAIGFIYGGIGKNELFDYVRRCGILPRKTFSIGEAQDKRYYMEARKIR
ncbi:MAG: DUF1015 domain-containing protein [Candidatus Limivicinus sp.]|jgi:uncharacterized protein (DUF1015 family)